MARRLPPSVRAWLLTGLVLLGGPAARAGSLGVLPSRVSLPSDGRPSVVRLENRGGAPTLVQVEVVPWSDDGAPGAATDEVIALPPVFVLEPGSEQVVRVALRAPVRSGREAAYRLLVTEVPDATADGVTFALRLSLPVFATPRGARPAPVWRVERSASGGRHLVLANRGDAHLRLTRLRVRRGDGGRVMDAGGTETVLAGDARRWTLPASALTAGRALVVEAETGEGPLRVRVATPGA